MCEKNPDLAGWAEAMCEQNGGLIFRLEPLKPSPLMVGYRNKCKFRIGKIYNFSLKMEIAFADLNSVRLNFSWSNRFGCKTQ